MRGHPARAHSNGFKTMSYIMWPPPAMPRLYTICGRKVDAVAEARERYGFERSCTDWREMVQDPKIDLFDNAAPNNLHAEPCIQAAKHGKHILCEKPLARNAAEAKEMLDAVRQAGVKHIVAFNYRFVPALQLAYDLIRAGRLGEVYHFRGDEGSGRAFGPDVSVPDDAPLYDRLAGFFGRNPI